VNVVVVNAIPTDELTGLARLVDDAVGALVSMGASVTVVQRRSDGQSPVDGILRSDPVSTTAGEVRFECWPVDHWSPLYPERLHFALEELIRSRSVTRVVVVGISEVGHVAAAACRLLDVPLCSVLTWEDCHVEHLRHPQRFASVIAASAKVLVHTASSMTHLRRLGVLADGVGEALAAPRLGAEPETPRLASVSDYVCSTGFLDDRILLNELMDRVVALIRSGYAQNWIHVGTVQPRILSPLVRHAARVGLADRMSITGWVPAEVLGSTVTTSRGLIKPAGRVETGIGVIEANRWGVPVSVPPGYPVEPGRVLEATAIERPPLPAPRLHPPERLIAAALERFVA
jgi:hypothetical protein